jgi:hypothetical protein
LRKLMDSFSSRYENRVFADVNATSARSGFHANARAELTQLQSQLTTTRKDLLAFYKLSGVPPPKEIIPRRPARSRISPTRPAASGRGSQRVAVGYATASPGKPVTTGQVPQGA